MKTTITAILLAMTYLLAPSASCAEEPYQVEWIQQLGTGSRDVSLSAAVDDSGNAYISGYTEGSLEGANAGDLDAFLTKFDSSGNELWTQQIGTSETDVSWSVSNDISGNTYIGGYTSGSLIGNNAGSFDAFLTKFDSDGNELWTQQIGTSDGDFISSLVVDGSGNVYASGFTSENLEGNNAGGIDAFLAKFDSSGNELWIRQIGTSSNDRSLSVAVDGSGNAYISGSTGGSLEGTNAGDVDAFLTKFDSSGNELWTQQIGTDGYDRSWSVAVDSSGNTYISGDTQGSLESNNAGGADVFLTKFDSSGNEVWTRQVGKNSADQSFSVAVDGSNNVYISGGTRSSLEGTNVGGYDAFLTKFNSNGIELWTQQIGTSSDDQSWSVAIDGSGNAYISGFTEGSLEGINAGSEDAFLVKFAVPEPSTLVLLAMGGAGLLLWRRRKG